MCSLWLDYILEYTLESEVSNNTCYSASRFKWSTYVFHTLYVFPQKIQIKTIKKLK